MMTRVRMPVVLDILKDRVAALVDDILADGPCFLVEVAVRGSAGSHAVDIFVESDDVLDAHRLGQISREVGYALDTDDVIPGRYMLNVSSPGAKRPLRLPRQYRKMVGRDLRVHYRKEDGNYTEVTGRLAAASSEQITLSVQAETLGIRYNDILWAKVQLPW